MMIIDKDTVSAVRQKIADPKKIPKAIKDVKKMLEINGTLLRFPEQCLGTPHP
jgi:hypothetical protein